MSAFGVPPDDVLKISPIFTRSNLDDDISFFL
jgi:hypothetical protein